MDVLFLALASFAAVAATAVAVKRLDRPQSRKDDLR